MVKQVPRKQRGLRLPRIRVTRQGWYALALTTWLAAATFMSHASVMLLILCVWCTGLLVGVTFSVINMQRLAARIEVPGSAAANKPIPLSFTVRNSRRRTSARGIAVSSTIEGRALEPHALFLQVRRRSNATEKSTLLLKRRGRYQMRELRLASRYPFGFIETTLRRPISSEILVYPQIGTLRRRFFEAQFDTHPQQDGTRPGLSLFGDDYHGLREFRDGDNTRSIHWPTTARMGQLMTKEFEARQNRDVAILLDPFLPEDRTTLQDELLELSLSFTATMCVELCKQSNLHIVLAIAGEKPIMLRGQSSQRLLQTFLAQLTDVQGHPAPDWLALMDQIPMKWANTMKFTTVSPRSTSLAERVPSLHSAQTKLVQMRRRLVQVDVGGPELRDFFELD